MWNASDISHLEIQTGPPAGSAYHFFCNRRGRHVLNWMALGLDEVSNDTLTEYMVGSGAAV